MNILEHQEAVKEFDSMMNDIIYEIEENRFEPSERGAGTAPTGGACKSAEDIVLEAIIKFKDIDLKKDYSFDEVVKEIEIICNENRLEPENKTDEVDSLKEIDCFSELADDKNKNISTIYEHKPSGRFLMVVETRCVKSEYTSYIDVSETSKEEKVTYEWS